MAVTPIVNSFNAGELSPLLYGRTDFNKYSSGCKRLENMMVTPYGAAIKRPGTEYIAEVKDSAKSVRLVRFEHSVEQAYIIEFGDQYCRFYRNRTQIESGGIPYEIATPYLEADLPLLQFVQSVDVMYIVHGSYAPMKLSRTGHTAWTLTEVTFTAGPFLTENKGSTTITPNAVSGSITLTASASIFDDPGHIGSIWQLRHKNTISEISGSFGGNGSSASMRVKGDWRISTHDTWEGVINVERSYDNGGTWELLQGYRSRNDYNLALTGNEVDENVLYRISMTSYGGGTCYYTITVSEFYANGIVEITAVGSGTSATATVLERLGDTIATDKWSEGAWSAYRGFPATLTFFEERLVLAGTNYKAQTVWASQSGDFENMRAGDADDDALVYTLAADKGNAIRWLVSQDALIIGTTGGEWRMSGALEQGPITPSNVAATRRSTFGSMNHQAVVVGSVILFVQRQERKVREFVFSLEQNAYNAPDVTILAEHITENGIVAMSYQSQPDSVLWCVRDDGELIGMTYERSEDVIGWHRHIIGGTDVEVESIAVIPTAIEDEVWISVKRTINGGTARYIEAFKPHDWGTEQSAAWFVDSGLAFDGGDEYDITGTTQADPVAVTCSGHPFSDDQQVRIVGVEGMMELNNKVFTVANAGVNTFSLKDKTGVSDIDGTAFGAYTSGGTAQRVENTFGSLDHLEGDEVAILADGGIVPREIVNAGQIALTGYYNQVIVGLPYTSYLQPMRLEIPTNKGTSQGKRGRVSRLTVKLKDSGKLQAGPDETHMETFFFRDMEDPMDTAVPLFTGDKEIVFDGDIDRETNIILKQEEPLPLTVLAIIPQMEIYG